VLKNLIMPNESWSSVEVRFIDLDQVLRDLRAAAAEASRLHPDVIKVYLFGSLVKGNWTADSDADLMVVVRGEFPDFARSRSAYQIFTSAIPTDTVVYSEREFEQLRADPFSLVAQEFPFMMEL
jgi:predicted nucleotidyltransferase